MAQATGRHGRKFSVNETERRDKWSTCCHSAPETRPAGRIHMRRQLRAAIGLFTAAVPAVAMMVITTPDAVAAPNFQVPFACGTTVTAATFSGHNPQNSVDFQKSGITGMPVLASAAGTVSRVANE